MTAQLLILTCLFLPLTGGGILLLAHRRPRLRELILVLTATLSFVSALALLLKFQSGNVLRLDLLTFLPGLDLMFEIEPLGALFAVLASGLWLPTSLYAIGYLRARKEEHQTRFHFWFCVAISATMGIAMAGNLLTLFVFYEVLTLSTYPLVTHIGNRGAVRGGRVYLGVLLGTSIGLLLPAMLWTLHAAGTLQFTAGGILDGKLAPSLAGLLLLMFVLGVGKAAVMPMHRWLPAAMVAPTPVSALLHAVAVVKAGVFTITKVVIYIFGTGFLGTVPAQRYLVYLAGFTVIAASVVALRQDNIKRLLAYSTISQLSYIVMASLALAPLALTGAGLHMVAHAFGKITLFFAAGAIYVAAHRTQVSELDGMGRRMPWTMAAFAVGALTMIGVPPSAGFVSKWFIIAGAYQADLYFVLAVIVLSTALNAFYMLPILHRAFFRAPEGRPHGEAPWQMRVALVGTAAASVLMFFFHAPILALTRNLGGAAP